MRSRLCQSVPVFLALSLTVPSLSAQEKAAQEKFTAADALALLKAGNTRFAKDKLEARDLGADRRLELVKAQKPFAIVLTCDDSRVVPEYLFDQGLGKIHVLRIGGNVGGPGIIGSIEYAIQKQPDCPLIVVLGHENCGVVKEALQQGKALVDPDEAEGHRGWLIKQIELGKDLPKDPKEALPLAIKHNAIRQAQLLSEKSPVIKEFVQSSRVQIVPAYYSLATGKVDWLELPKLTGKHPAFIRVTVPSADARIWLDDYETKSKGKVRIFEVPAVDVNEELSYSVKAQWREAGITVDPAPQTVRFKGGMTVNVEFK